MKRKHREKELKLPFNISFRIVKKMNSRNFYDGSLQSFVDLFFTKNFKKKYDCYAKPFGLFCPNKDEDCITGIDFIVCENNKNKDFFMNMYFEVQEKRLLLHYVGKNTKSSKKKCIKMCKALTKELCHYKNFKLFVWDAA